MREAPGDLRSAEQRLSTVRAVEQVMRAVWALARAQQPLVEAAAAEASAYLDACDALVTRLAGPAIPGPPRETLFVVVGPERPFCGPMARTHVDQLPEEGALGLVGTRMTELADQDPALAARVRFRLPAAVVPDEIGEKAEVLAGHILETAEDLDVVLMDLRTGSAHLTRTVLLGARRVPSTRPASFLPTEEVLEAAVVEAVAGRLAVALAEALRTEVRARLVATDSARRACEREADELSHRWRVLRQEAITAELVEITAARQGRMRR